MKQKHRRPETSSVAPSFSEAPPTSSESADWSRSTTALLVVMVLVACYVVIFYALYPLRQMSLLLIFAPEQLLRSWLGEVDELPVGILDRLPVLLVSGCLLAIAWASGSVVLRGWKLDERLTRLEVDLFSIGVGLSLWSTWTLLVGLLGMLHQTWLLWLPALVVTPLAGFQLAGRSTQLTAKPVRLPQRSGDWMWPSVLWAGLPFACIYVLSGMLPPREFDVLEYHLQAPKEWFQAGQITFLEHNIYANMPLGAEIFAILGMSVMPGADGWWYGALVGKTLLALMGVLAALVLFAAGRRIAGNTAGVVAALVYISTPWSHIISSSGFVEGALAFYMLLAVYAVWLWRTSEDTTESDSWFNTRSHYLQLAGFMAGSAAAVKYPALLFVVAPLAVAVTIGHRKFDAKSGLVFCLAALAGCGLWYGKNAVFAGNPVYPLAYSLFGGASRTPEQDAQWRAAHAVPSKAGTAYSPREFFPAAGRILLTSQWLSPLLAPLAALALLVTKQRKTVLWLLAFSAYFFLCWWLFTHRLDRFWAPLIVIVSLLAGIGASWSKLHAWRHFLIAILFWGMLGNFLLMSSWWPMDQASGAQESLPFNRYFVSLLALREVQTYRAHKYLNEHTPAGYSALLVGDAVPFDLQPPVLYNTCFDEVWFDRLFRDRTRDQRLQALREHKIAYIYFDWPEIARYRSHGNYGFSDYVTPELVREELVKEQKLLKKVKIEGLKDSQGEIYEVVGVVLKPE